MIIDADVRGICQSYTPAQSFAQLVQAIVTSEGDIVKAVQCSDDSIKTREQAIRVVCRSAIHRMTDWVQQDHPHEFVAYMGSKWAPVGAENDPHSLNANWVPNVSKLWVGTEATSA